MQQNIAMQWNIEYLNGQFSVTLSAYVKDEMLNVLQLYINNDEMAQSVLAQYSNCNNKK